VVDQDVPGAPVDVEIGRAGWSPAFFRRRHLMSQHRGSGRCYV
jgi:hypothetical protein